MNKLKIFILLISGAFSSSIVVAGNPTCSGKISGVSLSGSGGVYATIKGSSTNLVDVLFCQIGSTTGSFSGQSCNALLSMLMAGEATGSSATLWFNTGYFESCNLSWTSLKDDSFYHIKIN